MTQRQREAVLALLDVPRTVYELADETGGNRYALYRVVQQLVEDGLVVEQPWKKEKRIVYVKSTAPVRGVIMIKQPGGVPKPLGAFTGLAPMNPAQIMRGALSYIWRRSYHLPPVGEQWDATKPLGGLEPIKVKQQVRLTKDALRAMVVVLDQVLEAPIWGEEDRTLVDKFGSIPEVALVLGAAQEYEDWFSQTYPKGV